MAKEAQCDCCGRVSSSVVSMGRDANGEPDAPDVCWLCRRQEERGKVFDRKAGCYVSRSAMMAEAMRELEDIPVPTDLWGGEEIPF